MARRKARWRILAVGVLTLAVMAGCSEEKEHIAPAIHERDSVAMMTSYGVNTLISDSGVIKYRIVAEEWEMNEKRNPSRWLFKKGLFLEQFDPTLHVQSYIQCDTAYYYDVDKLWELRGRVRILSKNGLRFRSEELFWDERKHEIYSNKFSHLITTDRELQGTTFRSDERMTKYFVSSSKGSFKKDDIDDSEKKKSSTTKKDSTTSIGRQPASPRRKVKTIPLTRQE
jgi:LPS export ABC transporter protein LptC